jgi:hypothetical protein
MMPLMLPPQIRRSVSVALGVLLGFASLGSARFASAAGGVDFEKEILPLLTNACFKCHSAEAKKVKGEVRLDDVAMIRAKSRSDNLVFPHKPEKSLLYKVVSLPAGDDDVMPPADSGEPLSKEQVATIRKWIEEGANFGGWKRAKPRERPVAVEREPINAADVTATARRIDEIVEAGLAKKGVKPNAFAADDIWCRRVHLDLIGRIPTYDEMVAFLNSRDPQKRAKLIEALLASNGHVSAMFNYWCDALRARDQLADDARGDYYLHYLEENIRSNKPYDRWVREMVTAAGSLEQSPPVGFYLRDFGNRFASVDNTAILFLGTQIGCAQCHDHPYDQWTRRDYHQFAAWTSSVGARRDQAPMRMAETDLAPARAKLEKEAERRTSSERKQIERKLALEAFDRLSQEMMRDRPVSYLVESGKETKGQLPSDYQYPDGKPNAPIAPAVLFGDAKAPAPAQGARPVETFAGWLTSPENPRFALTIANRMWARIMGAPFAGRIENVREIEDCANPALAAYLTRLMVATKFDLRQFQKIIANTRTYLRQSGTLASSDADYDFAGPVLRRMSAEQAWDSLMALAVPNLDARMTSRAPETRGQTQGGTMTDANDVLAQARELARERAKDQIKAMNRPARPERQKRMPYAPAPEFDALVRASELPQPAPEGHFLRVFGQSNREVADGGWRSGTVPQTLMMLNSTLFDAIVQRGTPLYTAITHDAGDSGRLRAAFLSILGRTPTLEDLRVITSTMGGTGNIEAIAHTLLGTRQFLFIQ